MFTGIVSNQALLRRKKKLRNQIRLTFQVLGRSAAFRLGESVAVDGVCLTVAASRGREFSSDAIPETLQATTLGSLGFGERVNFERALRVGNSLGGHWVSGHVDGVGRIRKKDRRGENSRLQIEAGADIIRRLVLKGSVAVDGISFTVQEIASHTFVVAVTPHTYRVTALPWKRVGGRVNLEVDLLAKLVEHFLSNGRRHSLKLGELRRQGF